VPTLVRGLDYYTRTVFEFIGPEHGAQSAICAGGRYDGLIEEIGGPPTPGVGFGAGIERLLIALEDAGVGAPAAEPIDVFFAVDDGAPRERILQLLARLRAAGRAADTDYAGRSLKGQLTQARRLGARLTVIVGPAAATIREPGSQDVEVPLDQLEESLSA
jgi:histidyl-tRNA synthetase